MGLQAYYDGILTNTWQDRNPEECGCGGHGWFLSDLDTVHKCNLHYDGQPHPEEDFWYEEFIGPIQEFPYVPASHQLMDYSWDEDIIPF